VRPSGLKIERTTDRPLRFSSSPFARASSAVLRRGVLRANSLRRSRDKKGFVLESARGENEGNRRFSSVKSETVSRSRPSVSRSLAAAEDSSDVSSEQSATVRDRDREGNQAPNHADSTLERTSTMLTIASTFMAVAVPAATRPVGRRAGASPHPRPNAD
jgi:hypothetical protein